MITNIKAHPSLWNKKIWIAKYLDSEMDEYGNVITKYDIPKLYNFNYQPIRSKFEVENLGLVFEGSQKAVIPIEYENEFNEIDLAYLNGAEPTDELSNGDKANYIIKQKRIGNSVVILYFEKLKRK